MSSFAAPHGSALEEVWERRIEYLRKYEWERETLARMNEVKRCLRELRAHKRKMPNIKLSRAEERE